MDTEYTPTEKEILEHMASLGWPTWEAIRYDHLDETEAAKLQAAVEVARRFSRSLRDNPGVSMLLIASKPTTDNGHVLASDCTGYGCGKTMIAQIVHYTNSQIQYSPAAPGDLYIRPRGQYLEARQAMALFDKYDFDLRAAFSEFGNLVVVDDVGREGALRWEKRDPEFQLQEKRDRYYSLVDYCYDQKVSLIMTSNMKSTDLGEFLGGATWSRLLQMAPPEYRLNLTGIRDMRPLLARGRPVLEAVK